MDILDILWQLAFGLGQLVVAVLGLAWRFWPLIAWLAWWTFAVNWRRTREILKQGAWAPVVLLVLVFALVWSQIAPSTIAWETIALPNFWWQLGAVALLFGLTALCGLVQDVLGWSPPELDLNPLADSAAGPAQVHH